MQWIIAPVVAEDWRGASVHVEVQSSRYFPNERKKNCDGKGVQVGAEQAATRLVSEMPWNVL